MNDFQRVLASLVRRSEPCVLATVVRTQGSTYRKTGARMLIYADGTSVGAVSGGCLENDIVERSHQVLHSGVPKLLRYDTRSTPDDLVFGMAIGCQGITTVFLERLQGIHDPICAFVQEGLARREQRLLATVYDVHQPKKHEALDGYHMFFYPEHTVEDNLGESAFACELRHHIWNTASSHTEEALVAPIRGTFRSTLGRAAYIVEPIRLPYELLIIGAGYDALPLVHYALVLGWRITVLDHRPALLEPQRFTQVPAQTSYFPPTLLFVTRETIAHTVRHVIQERAPTRNIAVVLMTHNLLLDAAALSAVVHFDVGYIGLLGPKKRLLSVLDALHHQGTSIDEETLHRIHSPIGLDIGSDTPEEIALAITAEIQAVMHARSGGFLKHRRRAHLHS
ncbi:MAG: XdhC family protein [Bacteroidota bacterium]|nr:XdhC family protein [Candidatus Kapabacteria bacterium]MDW8220965.1 XdhC family protein [Bacteroidota bacterium]